MAEPKLSTVLPPCAAKMLHEASKTPPVFGDPLARRKAVDKTVERVKREYPQFFRKAGEDE